MNTLDSLLSLLVFCAAATVLIGLLTAALASASALLLCLQAYAYRRGIIAFLKPLRARIFTERGLAPSWRFLEQMTMEEAQQILHAGVAGQTHLPRGPLDLQRRVDTACQHPDVLADFRGPERIEVIGKLHRAMQRTVGDWIWWARAWCLLWALCLTVLALASMPNATGVNAVSIAITRLVLDQALLLAIGLALVLGFSGVLAARMMLRYFLSAAPADTVPPPAPVRKAPQSPCSSIGRAGAPVRAINFSSGGFDTCMHLGVTHALLVIQGRLPDVVVGLSAGAIQAVALADVMQAGDDAEKKFLCVAGAESVAPGCPPHPSPPAMRTWADLTSAEKYRLQQLRMLARVERLRHFIEHAQRAPERLLDAILPDTYQIEARRPLEPLQQPRLSAQERADRRHFVVTRSGLARLYNDLLNVPLSIATLTKVVRRLLGYVATADIPHLPRRWTVRAVELSRLWILLGANVLSAAKLSRLLLRALRRPPSTTAATASAIIFDSGIPRRIIAMGYHTLASATLLSAWLIASVATLPLLLLIAVPILALAAVRGQSNAELHLLDALQGVGVWLGVLVLWSVLILSIAAAGAWVLGDARHGVAAAPEWMTARHASQVWLLCTVVTACAYVIGRAMYVWGACNPRSFSERFLASYGLADAIFRDHGLRSYLAEIIDPNFYPRAEMNQAVAAALDQKASCGPLWAQADSACPPRILAHFCDPTRRLPNECIHVGVAVANTENGSLEAVPAHITLVDALMAATAITPWLPPVELDRPDRDQQLRKVLYIDGANVSQEPTHTLLKLLRAHRNPAAAHAYIYSVFPFPVSDSQMGDVLEPTDDEPPKEDGAVAEHASPPARRFHEYLDLVDIVWRAMRLQRFRDARLEQRLTELFTTAIPADHPAFEVPAATDRPAETFFRAWVTPIELDYDADLNRRLYRSAKSERRRLIAESIADGCRAALQVMIANAALRSEGRKLPKQPVTLSCRAAVLAHFRQSGVSALADILPGSEPTPGPGLPEICAHCTLHRPRVAEGASRAPDPSLRQRLRFRVWDTIGPDWPHERQEQEPAVDPDARFTEPHSRDELNAHIAWSRYAASAKTRAEGWPRSRDTPAETSPPAPSADDSLTHDSHVHARPAASNSVTVSPRPLVSLLFSGGVFRGVYQVGVLNALKSVGIEPDLIAGASVGSITAAMIAEAFSLEPNVDACVRIARLAGIYLSVDRLILTDRFADFVRAFTLRAADTRFSIRQADRLFRRYDQPTFYEFDRNARAVTAGIERLFYVTPYHLNAIVRAFREGNTAELTRVSNELIQRFLDRMQIGDQALGAEPLRDLIEYYVIGDKTSRSDHPVGLTIDQMRELHKIAFLATTTNITRGRLEVLGSVPSPPERAASVLVESLLASSAFPGVFRPRWSWEVTPGTQQIHQYIDGGVMDNLPVDAIATYLHRAARVGLIAAEPRVPHLIVGASLEVRAPSYALAFTRNRFRCSWAARQKRATQLGYNTKLDKYEYAERALRRIREHALTLPPTAASNIRPHPLVSMHLLPIKPQWLCGTFAFHPMLGFRRSWQAQSIAHGCATTLLELGKLKRQDPTALEHWGVQSNQVPDVASWQVALKAARPIEALKDGTCWLRSCPCPFSEKALKKQNVALKTAWEEWRASQRLGPSGATPAGANAVRKPQELPLEDTVIREVSKIHERCLRRQTHLRRI